MTYVIVFAATFMNLFGFY